MQLKPEISEPGDPYEREADAVATRVSSGTAAPADMVSRLSGSTSAQRETDEEDVQRETVDEDETVQRQEDEEQVQLKECGCGGRHGCTCADDEVQRAGAGAVTPAMQDTAATAIRSPGPGSSLPKSTQGRLESSMGVDLSGVQVHTGAAAQDASAHLHARAFTHGNNIWLGKGESASDVPLMAHEVTHVVQQDGVTRRKPRANANTVTVQRQPVVQRLIPDIVLEKLADYARHIPGWTLFTVIIGFNPLLGTAVPRNAMNLLEGLMGLVPFGTFIFDALRERGIIDAVFAWVEGELARLDLSLGRIERTIEAAWEEVDVFAGFDYNLAILVRHFTALYDDVVAFAESLVNKIIDMIKEAAIGLAEQLLAENRAWALIKKILAHDPLRDVPVEATPTEILEDFLLLIGQETHLQQMRERGTVEETANWLATQIGTFLSLLGELGGLFSRAWDAIQPENLPNLMSNLETLAADAAGFLQRVWDFATTVAAEVLRFIKDALLAWLASFAHEIPGFHLMTVILGRNPFTNEEVPRTAENLIRGFITLLPNGNEIYDRLAESGVIAGAAARIESAIETLGISWSFIVGIFTGLWNSFSIDDLVNPIGAFTRIVDSFGEPISRLFQFVGVVLREVIYLILQVMNFPFDLIGSIVENAATAIEDIKRDPIAFLENMLAAVKAGFTSFFDNIVTHLLGGLADWLFRGLRDAGIEPPRDLSLSSVLDFVLQVLGISMDRIWEKLAERIGQENVDRIRGAIDRLVGIWNFIRDVQERGVVAIWEYIESQISGLWDMVIEQAKNWIMERIIQRAIQWLLSLLDVTGIMPVINAFIAFFNAVQSAIEYLRDILAIINDYVTTIAAVARGEIQPGAEKLERGLANAIPIAIGFLANQFGFGNIGERISEIIGNIRGLVDRALDWLLDRAVSTVQSLMAALGFGGGEEEEEEAAAAEAEPASDAEMDTWWQQREPFSDSSGQAHTLQFTGGESTAELVVRTETHPVTQWLADRAAAVPEEQRGVFEQASQAFTAFEAARTAWEPFNAAYKALSSAEREPRREERRLLYHNFRTALRELGEKFTALPIEGQPAEITLYVSEFKPRDMYNVYRGRLAHSKNRPERRTRQRATWDRHIASRLPPEWFGCAPALELSRDRMLRPNWDPSGNEMQMDVDHIVEWQVRPLGDENLLDDPHNFELLDSESNQSSGDLTRTAIETERAHIAEQTRDQSWLFRDLTFTKIDGGGPGGIRWPLEDIEQGKHLDVYARKKGYSSFNEACEEIAPRAVVPAGETSTAETMEQSALLGQAVRSQLSSSDLTKVERLLTLRAESRTWEEIGDPKVSGLTPSEVRRLRSLLSSLGADLSRR